jgi:hypothetical protein
VLKISLQLYQNTFLPIKNMRNNLKFYANMKLLVKIKLPHAKNTWKIHGVPIKGS